MTGNHILRSIQDILLPQEQVDMSYFKEYENVDISMIFPPPPRPPAETYRRKTIAEIEYETKKVEWKRGHEDWKKRREEDIIHSRLEILDL